MVIGESQGFLLLLGLVLSKLGQEFVLASCGLYYETSWCLLLTTLFTLYVLTLTLACPFIIIVKLKTSYLCNCHHHNLFEEFELCRCCCLGDTLLLFFYPQTFWTVSLFTLCRAWRVCLARWCGHTGSQLSLEQISGRGICNNIACPSKLLLRSNKSSDPSPPPLPLPVSFTVLASNLLVNI